MGQLGIDPITLSNDNMRKNALEKDLLIEKKINEIIDQKIIEKENAPKGLEYYKTGFDFQSKQLESITQERDLLLREKETYIKGSLVK